MSVLISSLYFDLIRAQTISIFISSCNLPPHILSKMCVCFCFCFFFFTNWKFNYKKEPKIQPTWASQRNSRGCQACLHIVDCFICTIANKLQLWTRPIKCWTLLCTAINKITKTHLSLTLGHQHYGPHFSSSLQNLAYESDYEAVSTRKKERKEDNSDVVIGMNDVVASFSSWSKSTCNLETGNVRIRRLLTNIASFGNLYKVTIYLVIIKFYTRGGNTYREHNIMFL